MAKRSEEAEVTAAQVAEFIATHGMYTIADHLRQHGIVLLKWTAEDVQDIARREYGEDLPEYHLNEVLSDIYLNYDHSVGVDCIVISTYVAAQFEQMKGDTSVN